MKDASSLCFKMPLVCATFGKNHSSISIFEQHCPSWSRLVAALQRHHNVGTEQQTSVDWGDSGAVGLELSSAARGTRSQSMAKRAKTNAAADPCLDIAILDALVPSPGSLGQSEAAHLLLAATNWCSAIAGQCAQKLPQRQNELSLDDIILLYFGKEMKESNRSLRDFVMARVAKLDDAFYPRDACEVHFQLLTDKGLKPTTALLKVYIGAGVFYRYDPASVHTPGFTMSQRKYMELANRWLMHVDATQRRGRVECSAGRCLTFKGLGTDSVRAFGVYPYLVYISHVYSADRYLLRDDRFTAFVDRGAGSVGSALDAGERPDSADNALRTLGTLMYGVLERGMEANVDYHIDYESDRLLLQLQSMWLRESVSVIHLGPARPKNDLEDAVAQVYQQTHRMATEVGLESTLSASSPSSSASSASASSTGAGTRKRKGK